MQKLALSIPGSGGTPMKIDSGLPTGVQAGGIEGGTLDKILGVGVEFAIVGAVLFCLFNIIIGGINLITSEGDKKKFQSGRDKVVFAIVGLIVIFMSFFMVNLAETFFGINLLGKTSPNSTIPSTTTQEQAPASISDDQKLMGICITQYPQKYCECLRNKLPIEEIRQAYNSYSNTNQIPLGFKLQAQFKCGNP